MSPDYIPVDKKSNMKVHDNDHKYVDEYHSA